MKNHAQSRKVVLGLGSNLGDRMGYLSAAIAMLTTGKFRILHGPVAESLVYESPALLMPNAPESWDTPFYNMAICGQSSAPPSLLLHTVKKIELLLGRKTRGRWAPREIDIDILAIEDVVLARDALVIPHPGLLEREFAFLPFADIWPEWEYPVAGNHYGKAISEIIAHLPQGMAKPPVYEKLAA